MAENPEIVGRDGLQETPVGHARRGLFHAFSSARAPRGVPHDRLGRLEDEHERERQQGEHRPLCAQPLQIGLSFGLPRRHVIGDAMRADDETTRVQTGRVARVQGQEGDAQYAPWAGLASRPMPGTPVEDGLP